MSSSEGSEEETDDWMARDSKAEKRAKSLLDKKPAQNLLGDTQNDDDYLSIMRRASRKISVLKQLQQEFPDRVRRDATFKNDF